MLAKITSLWVSVVYGSGFDVVGKRKVYDLKVFLIETSP